MEVVRAALENDKYALSYASEDTIFWKRKEKLLLYYNYKNQSIIY